MLATAPPPDHLVTSSDLVRHFGIWQERAAHDPVYILHRGRPRLVLTSVEVMEALCAPHDAREDGAGRIDALLAVTGDLVFIADANLRITATSRTAQRHFGPRADAGAPLAAIAPADAAVLFDAALRRVLETGSADEVDLHSATRPARTLTLRIEPHGDGLMLIGQDATIAQEWREASDLTRATAAAVAAMEGIATAQINLRGHLDAPDAALARLTGLDADTLARARFVSLVDIASRVAVSEAIEAVCADGEPRAVAATLLVNRGAPRSVRIGLAARRVGLGISGVVAVITAAAID